MTWPQIFHRLLDDAAVFPPGNAPLPLALSEHARHHQSGYRDLVGPFVLSAADIPTMLESQTFEPPAPLELSLTAPLPDLAAAASALWASPTVHVTAWEVSLPSTVAQADVIPTLDSIPELAGVPIFVELPRDFRRAPLITALASTGYLAKLRTGGIRADLYPDELELGALIVALTNTGVAFKATAGLHHALRNTDPHTGFEQHGFLNVLWATDLALQGASLQQVTQALAERDQRRVVAGIESTSPLTRTYFRSFGTCSVTDPLTELQDLGLVPRTLDETSEEHSR